MGSSSEPPVTRRVGSAASPMWLAHHHPDGYERCVRIGSRHVCRRCLVLYPVAVAVAVVQVAGVIPSRVGVWLMWSAPIGVTVEWVLEQLGRILYAARRQAVLTAVAAVSLGIAFGRHARHPFELAAVAPTLTYLSVCLLAWFVGARRAASTSAESWRDAFDRTEDERLERLRGMVGGDVAASGQPSNAVTKSISSSTAPTSDGSRSL